MNPQIPNSQPQGTEAYRQIAERLNRQSQTQQPFYPYVPTTSSVTVTSDYGFYPCDASGGAVAVTMPSAVAHNGYEFDIKKTDSSGNAVTITPFGSETIDGAASVSMIVPQTCLTLKSDGSNWHIV